MGYNPVVSLLISVVFQALLEDITHRHDHLFLYISHPELNVSVFRIYSLNEVDFLAFYRHHGDHAIVITELQVSDSFEDLSQVTSDSAHLFCLRKNLEQVIIRQEIEASEVRSFLLQVLFETLLDELKVFVSIDKVLFKAIPTAILKDAWCLVTLVHDVAPLDVDALETLCLSWQLFHDIS